jgi:hypothetical protein
MDELRSLLERSGGEDAHEAENRGAMLHARTSRPQDEARGA